MKKRFINALWLCAALVVPVQAEDKESGEWTNLFNGKDLTGFSQKNGTATYEVKDGTILGTTVKGSPNSFLCTDKLYGDFDLTFEVKVHNSLNSGVMIRSQTKGGTAEGRVKALLKPHKHFKDGEWNRYRIMAKGPRIQVWINEVRISDLVDEAKFKAYPKGFIGLQVHGVGKGGPFDVAWKKLKIRELK
jgi:hypothetical protein